MIIIFVRIIYKKNALKVFVWGIKNTSFYPELFYVYGRNC